MLRLGLGGVGREDLWDLDLDLDLLGVLCVGAWMRGMFVGGGEASDGLEDVR